MRLLLSEGVVQLALFVAIGSSGTVYITDLPIFSALAPCAADGVSYIVQGLTGEKCPASVTALQSCACTQDQNSAAVSASIASDVKENCGNTASEDLASASLVFSAYCNQAASVPLPTGVPVTQYITDLPAYSNLGNCAADAVSYIVQGLTAERCPAPASLLASCACSKDQNSLAVSESINSDVAENCGSTATEDFASAQAVFAGYCAMGAGTTSFASPSYLAGKVTYYITDLPTYSALAPCAQDAVSYPIAGLVQNDCPAAPLAVVSCVCVKNSNSQVMSSQIVSQVGENCGTTASADVTSALGVFAYYCSAGQGLVTPSGVTASVTTTPYGTGAGTFATATNGRTYTFGPSATSTNAGGTIQLPGSSTSNKVNTGAIVGGAVGGLLGFLFILWAGWKLHHRTPRPAELSTESPNANASEKIPVAGVVSRFKPTPSMDVSPVSPVEEEESPLAQPGLEVATTTAGGGVAPPHPGYEEVPGSIIPPQPGYGEVLGSLPLPPELHGSAPARPGFPPEVPPGPRPSRANMVEGPGWNQYGRPT